jgi:hypothetical protein
MLSLLKVRNLYISHLGDIFIRKTRVELRFSVWKGKQFLLH